MRAEERKRMMHVSLKKSIREPRKGGNSDRNSVFVMEDMGGYARDGDVVWHLAVCVQLFQFFTCFFLAQLL
jgi:hypothetical protein